LDGFADVRDDVAALDRVTAHEVGHGRLASRLHIDELTQALVLATFEKSDAPAVLVFVGASAALDKA
jgi:hypothetical protein